MKLIYYSGGGDAAMGDVGCSAEGEAASSAVASAAAMAAATGSVSLEGDRSRRPPDARAWRGA